MEQQLDPFQLLSNEEIDLLCSYLDPISFWRFGATSRRFFAFRDLTNQQWRQKYAKKYHLNDDELACYDLDWPVLLIHRHLKEISFIKSIEEELAKQQALLQDPYPNIHGDTQNSVRSLLDLLPENTNYKQTLNNEACGKVTADPEHVFVEMFNSSTENFLKEDNENVNKVFEELIKDDNSDYNFDENDEIWAQEDEDNGEYPEESSTENYSFDEEDEIWDDEEEFPVELVLDSKAFIKEGTDIKYHPLHNPFYKMLCSPQTDFKDIDTTVALIYAGFAKRGCNAEEMVDQLVTFMAKHLKEYPQLMEYLKMTRMGKYLYNYLSKYPETSVALGSLSFMLDHLTVDSPYCGLVLTNMTTMVEDYVGSATVNHEVWSRLGIWSKVLDVLKKIYNFGTIHLNDLGEDERAVKDCLYILLSNPPTDKTLRCDTGLRKIFIDIMKKWPEQKYGSLEMAPAAKYFHWPGDDYEELSELIQVYLKESWATAICVAMEASVLNSDDAKQFLASNEELVQRLADVLEQNEKNLECMLYLISHLLETDIGQQLFWQYKDIDALTTVFGEENDISDPDVTKRQIFGILRTLNKIAVEKGAKEQMIIKDMEIQFVKHKSINSDETIIERNLFWISYLALDPPLPAEILEELFNDCIAQIVMQDEVTTTALQDSYVNLMVVLIRYKSSILGVKNIPEVNERIAKLFNWLAKQLAAKQEETHSEKN